MPHADFSRQFHRPFHFTTTDIFVMDSNWNLFWAKSFYTLIVINHIATSTARSISHFRYCISHFVSHSVDFDWIISNVLEHYGLHHEQALLHKTLGAQLCSELNWTELNARQFFHWAIRLCVCAFACETIYNHVYEAQVDQTRKKRFCYIVFFLCCSGASTRWYQ